MATTIYNSNSDGDGDGDSELQWQRRSPNAARRNAYNEWNYSKLRIWQLTEYDKIIFVDSDLVTLRNIDEFFQYPQLSAVGNDQVLFNSGIILIEPSKCTFRKLMDRKQKLTWWNRWPSTLNYLKVFEETKSSEREKLPESLYTIHYLGLKPWMCYRDYDCNWDMGKRHIFASDSAHRKWWQVFDAMPKTLRPYYSLTKKMDARINKWRERAKNASLPDRHWKIKVKDLRQHH
ncbi:PREDICTED: putative UDP-glucuronate:xylan alpha-glucuronosyltransferase 4 [Nelumbo nucifera]|uniref:Hexosyltransferase n=1 Tax=Nelumbo nucifera TaxID=4432 RepID=A0A1U8AZV9_NELNU|nr:PREDICTED: putative UDP-glucuronate:xylan alpha-glucuronosyltransferase 4 [Nelumbo nucifera]